jgi:tetratricopeptide (TPR) repeat protein
MAAGVYNMIFVPAGSLTVLRTYPDSCDIRIRFDRAVERHRGHQPMRTHPMSHIVIDGGKAHRSEFASIGEYFDKAQKPSRTYLINAIWPVALLGVTSLLPVRTQSTPIKKLLDSIQIRRSLRAIWPMLIDADGQTNNAHAAYEHAIDLAYKDYRVNPRDADTLSSLSLYYAKKGDTAQALETIHRARTLQPDAVQLLDVEAIVNALANRRKEALAAIAQGYSAEEFKNEPELRSLRSVSEFQRLLAEADSKKK